MSDNYALRRLANGVIVEMADHVPFPPASEERDELQRLVEEREKVVVDLNATKSLATLRHDTDAADHVL